MLGLMQQRPLLISSLLDYAERYHAGTEIALQHFKPTGLLERRVDCGDHLRVCADFWHGHADHAAMANHRHRFSGRSREQYGL